MACTGDLPPNCKGGQAFISDPSLHSTAEVKGQIKLKLTSVLGKPMVCTRNFTLTQKPNKKEYKAFEAALVTLDGNGQKQAMSYKCADLNKLLPELMGVSAAVLESVVFVHQEHSLWPLSEDKVLKDKFDNIFASSKFTKALDELRSVRSKKQAETKVLNAEYAHLEEALANANRLRYEQEQFEADLVAIDAKMKADKIQHAAWEREAEPLEQAKRIKTGFCPHA